MMLLINCVASGEQLKTTEFPKDVIYTLLPSGEHQYIIKNAIVPSKYPPVDPAFPFKMHGECLPQGTSLSVDENAKTLTILSPKPINNLVEVLDILAGTGNYYYGSEIYERGKKSPDYIEGFYKLAFAEKIRVPIFYYVENIQAVPNTKSLVKITVIYEVPEHKMFSADIIIGFKSGKYFAIVDTPISIKDTGHKFKNGEGTLSIKYQNNKRGNLSFNKMVCLCMCYNSYAMRIFDSKGEYVWEDVNNIRGDHYPFVFDFNNDGIDEVIVVISNHDGSKILVFAKE